MHCFAKKILACAGVLVVLSGSAAQAQFRKSKKSKAIAPVATKTDRAD